MAEPTAISAILEPLSLIFNGIYAGITYIDWPKWGSRLGRLLYTPFHYIILTPLFFVFRVIFVLLSPLIYILGCFLSGIQWILGVIASLEPLYTFFGVAAFIGIFAGLCMATTSAILTSTLNLKESPRAARARRRYIKDTDSVTSVESSSNEAEWQWLDTSTSPVRRRPVGGLLSQTILEEEDSSDAML